MDELIRFAFEHAPVRGALVRLDDTWQEMRARHAGAHGLPLLGEAAAACTLMSSGLKMDGRMTLQLQGGDPLRLLLVQVTNCASLRGTISASAPMDQFRSAAAGAQLVLTVEPDRGSGYQGIINSHGSTLSECLESYFLQSEQLPTRLWLGANEHSAAGMMLQRLPGDVDDDDLWNRVQILANTVTSSELLNLDPRETLVRLFHEEHAALGTTNTLRFECHCDEERVRTMIRGLGEEEAREALDESGMVTVDCGFCNERYEFDAVDVVGMFHDAEKTHPTPQ